MFSSLFQRLTTRKLVSHSPCPVNLGFATVVTDGEVEKLDYHPVVSPSLASDYSISANVLCGRSGFSSPMPIVDPVDTDMFENSLYN